MHSPVQIHILTETLHTTLLVQFQETMFLVIMWQLKAITLERLTQIDLPLQTFKEPAHALEIPMEIAHSVLQDFLLVPVLVVERAVLMRIQIKTLVH